MTLKSKLSSLAFLLFVMQTSQTLAHDITGQFSNPGRFAMEYWQIICSAGTNHLYFRVKDFTPNSARVGVMVQKGNKVSHTRDLTDTDALFSTFRKFAQGVGTYNLFIYKTNTGDDQYIIQAHCEDANGEHTETEYVQRQDQ